MIAVDDIQAITLGFIGALFAFAVAIWFVGLSNILTALSMARSPVLLTILIAVACWMTAWGLSLRVILGVLGIPMSVLAAVLVFASATFANNITPFGQAGGEPISAHLISRASESQYETALAAIASFDALNIIPSLMLAVFGLGYFAITTTFNMNLRIATTAVLGFAIVVPSAVCLGWYTRHRLERTVIAILVPLVHQLMTRVPRLSPIRQHVLERRIQNFFTAVERVATNPQGVLLAVGFLLIGWIGLATSLWLSLFALGYAVSPVVVLVATPAGAMASIVPSPGGLGSVGAVLGALVAATTGDISAATIAAAILIHRSATYVLPTMIGGGTTAILSTQ